MTFVTKNVFKASHTLSVFVFFFVTEIKTRLTVGRVKPLLDYTRLYAHVAIMILYMVCSGKQFPVQESFFTLDF